MPGLLKMLRRMFVLGTVTAPHMPARETHAQIDPRVADLYAILAHRDVLRMDVADLVSMGANFIWHISILT